MGQYYLVVFLGDKPADGTPEVIRGVVDPQMYGSDDPKTQILQNSCCFGGRLCLSGENLNEIADQKNRFIDIPQTTDTSYPFIVNHTKKLWIDMRKMPIGSHGDQVHPLPILTCEGNGRGGGDYLGNYPHVGTWARDVISVEKLAPPDYNELEFTVRGMEM